MPKTKEKNASDHSHKYMYYILFLLYFRALSRFSNKSLIFKKKKLSLPVEGFYLFIIMIIFFFFWKINFLWK